MANLNLIKSFNERFEKNSPIRKYDEPKFTNESLDPSRIEKGFKDGIANLGPNYTRYFDYGFAVHAVLLFIDICDFSTRKGNLKGTDLADYFDSYYDIIIPTIYKYGGEVEKIIGDGIICVFSPPFLDKELAELLELANDCAKELITITKGTDFTSKVAIHCGEINYFKNKSEFYNEYTMIGKPLTELFRLESVSNNECVNFYENSQIYGMYEEEIKTENMLRLINYASYAPFFSKSNFVRYPITSLKGVDFSAYYSLKV